MLSAPLSSGAAGAVDVGAVGAVNVRCCWHCYRGRVCLSTDRRHCGVAFVKQMPLRGGIREADDIARWHLRDR